MKEKYVIQKLTDAFQILKDSWPEKKESIINCIVSMNEYDGDLAMEMWLNILVNNEKELMAHNGSNFLIYELLQQMFFKHEQHWGGNYYICKVYLKYLIPYAIKNKKLLLEISGKADNGGFCNNSLNDEYIISLYASIFLTDNAQIAKLIFESFISNPLVDHKKIGDYIRMVIDTIINVQNNIDEFEKPYTITSDTIHVLMNCLDQITDEKSRAECIVAILSIA